MAQDLSKLSEADQIRSATDKTDKQYLEYISNFFDDVDSVVKFDIERYGNLKRLIFQMARKYRSVNIVKHFLKMIFVQDLDEFRGDPEELNEKIVMKMELSMNLASCARVSLQELFTYSSSDICGKLAYLIIQSPMAIDIFNHYIGDMFFIKTILPRAWFYLLKNELISQEIMTLSFYKMKIKLDQPIQISIKNSLYECIAKIAITKKLTPPQRKSMISMIRNVFSFKSDQELQELYKNKIDNKMGFFESQVLNCLMKKLGFGKYYFLEKVMSTNESLFTLPFYRRKDQLNKDFMRKKPGSDDPVIKNFLMALEFLNKELKKNPQMNSSDYAVCFLDVFHFHILKNLEDSRDSMDRQGILMQFIRTVELLIKKTLVEDESLRKACVFTAIYILRIGINKEDTVEIAMLSMQMLLNSLGLKHSVQNLDRFFTLACQAFLLFPNNQKVKKYISKILAFYIKDKQAYTQSLFQDYQFLLLKKLQDYQPLKEIVTIIAQQIYNNEEQIAESLKYLFSSLQNVNEDQRILNTTYILELLETKEQNEIRKVLVSPEILKCLYQYILDLPQSYRTEYNKQISIICAKIIACIGLCQPFVNDPLTLKATNQTTLIGKKRYNDQQKPDSYGAQNVTKSDHFNPITNMHLRKQDTGEDNTLELLAMPVLNEIAIERKEIIKFAEQLYQKIIRITHSTDEAPKNHFYAQFLIDKFINHQRQLQGLNQGDDQSNEIAGQFYFKQEQLSQAVGRFINLDLSQYKELIPFKQKNNLRYLAYYLITRVQEKPWQELFISCIPLIQKSWEFLDFLIHYLIYYAIRFSPQDHALAKQIGDYMNEVLETNKQSTIQTILKAQDFLSIALQQDKAIFKTFIEKVTKFKYIEKLFFVDIDISKAKDQTVMNFIKIIESDNFIKHSFLTVQKIKMLLNQVDKQKRIKGAQIVKNFKRCVYNFEDNFRSTINQAGKGFLDILTQEEAIEIVQLMKKLNPEDFDSPFFNSIIQTFKMNINFQSKVKLISQQIQEYQEHQQQQDQRMKNLMKEKFSIPHINEYWKNGQWDYLQEWMQGLDINEMNQEKNLIILDRDNELSIQRFEYLIAIFASEYSKALKFYLTSEDTHENKDYKRQLEKIDLFFKMLYHEFMINLDEQQGEIQYFYKLFLHVIYELESAVHYIKDIFIQEKEKIGEILKKEVNKDKRKFEKIYYEFDMNKYFEKLMSWFEERSLMIQSSTESLKLIYFTRRMIFSLFDRENEYAYYLMRLARLYRKTSTEILSISRLFKECGEMQHRIIDYELENAKYQLKTTNAHDAYRYLQQQLDNIKKKCDDMYKATRFHWMPQKIYEKSFLFAIELQIKYDPRNSEILTKFENFLKNLNTNKDGWEKPYFKFAQYLDFLDSPATGIQQPLPQQQADPKKRNIQKIYYFMNSLKYGHKYIWQSLPRTLELWFQYNDQENDVTKINEFMRQELHKLEIYKLATVLQILLSRYGHTKEVVREIINSVLSKIAISYPGQCAWWIFHFLHFEQEGASTTNKRGGPPGQQIQRSQAITRAEFAKTLLNKIHAHSETAYKKIIECEKIFIDLKKLSEKNPATPQATTMEMPQTLSKVSASNLVMPIEENLSPQLPPPFYQINFLQSCLVCTTEPINIFNPKNAYTEPEIPRNMGEEGEKEEEKLIDYPAFRLKPVTISGFLPEATIMVSKEKPKKIGIIGSDRNIYNFLLKCDKYGDLRKEQRFIDFAVLCNKMLESDSESRKRNLRLRTYAIVPLSRNTGLIEWIQNTTTMKTLIGDHWKKNNIKGEMHDVKQKAQNMKAGETHTPIWHIIKDEIKPVLGSYMAEHYPSPAIWYEARINYIRSTAMWSMIGYVIGLGDRHGDNILIHNHTGEVTHVDFDCIFEKGAKLKIPEIVPFRLTQNIIDAFGIFKEKGVFQRTCEVVQRVLRKNSNNIISFLYSFIHDPLIESTNNIKVDINDALEVVKKKLYGQISGDRGGSVTIEEQVEQVILNALNDEALSKMYIGWMPWL